MTFSCALFAHLMSPPFAAAAPISCRQYEKKNAAAHCCGVLSRPGNS